MMINLIKILAYLNLANCSKSSTIQIPKISVEPKTFNQSQVKDIALNDPKCPQGGILDISWLDKDKADGVYTEGKDTNYKEKAICFKPTIALSLDNMKGQIKIITTEISNKDNDCKKGGRLYESFSDVDGNGRYDSKIDTQYSSKKICYEAGGLTGPSSVTISTPIKVGDVQCPNGGFKLDHFVDVNHNGSYETTIDTFHTQNTICHGSKSVTITSTLPNGDSVCLSGGLLFNSFIDINNNGLYDATVDLNSRTYKVCNGSKALILETALNQGDLLCPYGGVQISTCVDTNSDNDCTSLDTDYTLKQVCNGSGSQYKVSTENPGVNCKSGGYQLERYQDVNNNNIYDIGTDSGYTSQYICNGLNWLSKTTSFTVGAGSAADNTGCPAGGIRFEFGYDHVNSNDGSYNIGIDGTLDASEIIPSKTAYTCNGASSNAGPLIATFQNDSVGSSARFYWQIVSTDGSKPNVKLAYSSTKAAIQAWNCENSLPGVTVVNDFSSCTGTYSTANIGPFTLRSQCEFDLTMGPFNINPWDYRYFKLCAQNTSIPNSQSITSYRVAGNVPSGMVMVHQDDWPIHEFINTNIVPFTYAIDKWKATSAVVQNYGKPATCTSTNCISNITTILDSKPNGVSINLDWYTARQGCLNRMAQGYTGSTSPRQIHLQTEMENFVATYGTPDDYAVSLGLQRTLYNTISQLYNVGISLTTQCAIMNYWSNFSVGYPTQKDCISRYGSTNMIGLDQETFNGYYENMNNNVTRKRSVYWGTPDIITVSISDAALGYSIPTSGANQYHVQDWDYQNLLPKTYLEATDYNPNPKFFLDMFLLTFNNQPQIVFNGIDSYSGNYGYREGWRGGRFSKGLGFDSINFLSARCAVISP